MFTLKTGKAVHEIDPAGYTILAVPTDIVGAKDVVLHSTRLTFPLTTTPEEIRAALERHLAVYTEDHVRHEGVKEHQAKLDSSAETAEEISNITI